jgi:hypothetical protein
MMSPGTVAAVVEVLFCVAFEVNLMQRWVCVAENGC